MKNEWWKASDGQKWRLSKKNPNIAIGKESDEFVRVLLRADGKMRLQEDWCWIAANTSWAPEVLDHFWPKKSAATPIVVDVSDAGFNDGLGHTWYRTSDDVVAGFGAGTLELRKDGFAREVSAVRVGAWEPVFTHLWAPPILERFWPEKWKMPVAETPQPESVGTRSAADIVSAALGHMQDRATTYDSPGGERSMGSCVEAFNTLTGHALTEEQGWLFMCVLKITRTQQGKFRADNYEDLAAYAGLAGEAAAKTRGQ